MTEATQAENSYTAWSPEESTDRLHGDFGCLGAKCVNVVLDDTGGLGFGTLIEGGLYASTPSTNESSSPSTKANLTKGEEILAHVLERQISYFADAEGIQGCLDYICGSFYTEVFRVIWVGFDKQNPRGRFARWKGIEPVLKDLVCQMTAFDPRKRITAREGLAHPWF
ncbi:hypothetical protein GX50_03835 [[Emmonsia] crescens]|uniref:Protein kinase domain-containing protein n=1 Tax=[Emmonsia] crescens TaxID=73230 RepID=A0A2B7ZJM0_9EURO|nr:hypothetical protein GX50_03835 [Emmonsia crescens]